MNKTFEQGRDEVAKLCDYFAKNVAVFNTPRCKEAHVRQDLIDPLFRALGWDVGNAARVSPHLVEVKVEDSLDVEGQNKAPDYAFRVGEQVRFYVEAKKCGANIATDQAPAYQLRRYGWSAKVAVSILTDFEELAVYDCTTRPRPNDKASRSRTFYCRYDEYLDCWRELWDIFSREAVWTGGFDQYAASKRKRGTSEVDNEFLKDIENWRDELARNIARRNRPVSSEDLNRAVQLTIDRVVFLRMAEDRGLEPDHQLLKLSESPNIYARFMRDLCRKADDKYNSGLFHFQKETGVSESPDTITTKLTIDDKVFKPILQSLYFDHGSPYHFGVLPVEILGTVYERFLGKVIRLTPGGQAKVEQKPEVRKAGGVYYTPSYIVNYIVRQTVGRQIEGKSPTQLAGKGKSQPLRVLDIACGSGSFLLGAYQFLLDYYLKWYIDHGPKKFPKAVYATRAGECRLAITEKKRILTTHIYGVDIDPQAVEVTKLSLLLKVLEGESAETIGDTMRLFHERALPNLSDNIKCGNSLIGPDFYEGQQMALFNQDDRNRINVFDWNDEFPQAMKAGGFDTVIGNPPYVNVRILLQTQGEVAKEYFERTYDSAFRGYDLYVLFIEKAFQLLHENAMFGMIVPNKLGTLDYSKACRTLLLTSTSLQTIVDLSHCRVFENASVYPYVVIWKKRRPTPSHKLQVLVAHNPLDLENHDRVTPLLQSRLSAESGFSIHGELDVESRVSTRPLSECSRLDSGTTGFAAQKMAISLIDKGKSGKSFDFIVSGNIDRYSIQLGNVRFMKRRFAMPKLPHNSPVMTKRKRALYASRKIVVAGMTKRLEAAIDETGLALGVQVFSVSETVDNLFYVLALLNSSLMSYLFRLRFQAKHLAGGFLAINKGQLEKLPIRLVDGKGRVRTLHDQIVKKSETIGHMHRELASANSSHSKTAIQRHILSVDRQIDQLVYELYGLTEKEIHIIEEATATVAK